MIKWGFVILIMERLEKILCKICHEDSDFTAIQCGPECCIPLVFSEIHCEVNFSAILERMLSKIIPLRQDTWHLYTAADASSVRNVAKHPSWIIWELARRLSALVIPPFESLLLKSFVIVLFRGFFGGRGMLAWKVFERTTSDISKSARFLAF